MMKDLQEELIKKQQQLEKALLQVSVLRKKISLIKKEIKNSQPNKT